MTSQALWYTASFAVLSFGCALGFLVRRLLRGATDGEAAATRVAGDYYKPMGRLLSEGEFRMVTAAGLTSRQVKQLRASRRRLFRQYLTELQGDFRALHLEARTILRDSTEDRPDLAVELVRQYAEFHCRVAFAHLMVEADSLGFRPAAVAPLLRPVQWMHQQVELLRTPLPSAA